MHARLSANKKFLFDLCGIKTKQSKVQTRILRPKLKKGGSLPLNKTMYELRKETFIMLSNSNINKVERFPAKCRDQRTCLNWQGIVKIKRKTSLALLYRRK